MKICEALKSQVSNNSSMLSMLPIIANCLKDDHYVDKPTPIYHISKEVIRPYYLGWIIKKKTLWRNIINDHILRIKEVSKKKHFEPVLVFCGFLKDTQAGR